MSVDKFLLEYGDSALAILPVDNSDSLKRLAGESQAFGDDDVFPSVEREHSLWSIRNLSLVDSSDRLLYKRELNKKYQDSFKTRLAELLDGVGARSSEDRLSDLFRLRDEFFAYPEAVERDLIGELVNKECPGGPVKFRNYGAEAIAYSRAAIPRFNARRHFSPDFSGFVMDVEVRRPNSSWNESSLFKAQYCYINRGKLAWSVQQRALPGGRVSFNDHIVSWNAGDFVIREICIADMDRPIEESAPGGRYKRAAFRGGEYDVCVVEERYVDGRPVVTIPILQGIGVKKIRELHFVKDDGQCDFTTFSGVPEGGFFGYVVRRVMNNAPHLEQTFY